jgi:hypothetical protein
MRRWIAGLVVAPLLLATLAAPAAAQSRATETPFPGYERTDEDLGTWDAVLAGRDGFGRPVRIRFVETNTGGCDRSGVRTDIKTASPLISLSGPDPWWTVLRLAGQGAPRSDLAGAARLDSASEGRIAAVLVTAQGRKGVLVDPSDSWIDIERPSADRRVVTVFGKTPSGITLELLRIVYTRRPSPAVSR